MKNDDYRMSNSAPLYALIIAVAIVATPIVLFVLFR